MEEKIRKAEAFLKMSAIDITPYLFIKNGMKYLPWSKAIELLKLHYPDAVVYECTFTTHKIISALVSETKEGKVYENHLVEVDLPYWTDGRTCLVKTRLVIPSQGIDECCTLPVMDFKNQCIPADKVTMYDVNKALRRCGTKNIAIATGLGLSLWHKEEISETAEAQKIIMETDSNEAIDKIKALVAQGFDRQKIMNWMKKNYHTMNPKNIKDPDLLAKLIDDLDKLDIKDFAPDKKAK